MNSPSTRARSPLALRRRGFTLVELLVVIVVIAILIALLLPAINGAVRTAKVGAASAEISQLAQAIAQFKSTYGVDPPSRIVLSETGNYSPAYLGAAAPLGPQSVSYLRRIWPKMVLNTTNGVSLSTSQIPGGFYDFNGDSVMPTVSAGLLTKGQIHVLDGAECLVFFLGGMPGMGGTSGVADGGFTTIGFSKNPANPFISPLVAAAKPDPTKSNPLAANRSAPTYEFRPGRLNDMYPKASGGSGNGFPEYSDNLSTSGTPQPFVYFSSYEGAGYNPDDVNYSEDGQNIDGTNVPAIGAFYLYNATKVGSFAPNPYTNGSPLGASGNTVEYINKNSFQIISAGIDGQFGPGGSFKTGSGDPLAATAAELAPITLAPSMRLREKDNVTNFKGGRLD